MDAKSFCSFLKEQLVKEAEVYENNLSNTSYATIEETKRAGGIKDALRGVVNSVDNILVDFYVKNNVTLPTPVPPVDAS